jgi:HEAT repeat protein
LQDAANALGYLGNAKAEPKLIEALAEGKSWLQMNACRALATIGTSKALPALEKLAKNGLVGVLNVQGMARDAIEQIVKREKR